MKFYLCGPIDKVADFSSWREEMTRFLKSHGDIALNPLAKYSGKGGGRLYKHMIEDMLQKNEVSKARVFIRKIIMKPDFDQVRECDAILAYIPKGARVWGSVAEITEGHRLGKTIIIVTDIPIVDSSGWMIGQSDILLKSFEEFKDVYEALHANP